MNEFDDIRPYHDDEVKGVITRLLADTEFLDFLGNYRSPRLSRYLSGLVRFITRHVLKRQLGSLVSIKGFQEAIASYATRIVAETMTRFEYEGVEKLSKDQGYLFVGNHRDIAGDSMLVNYALWQSNLDTVRIAVGDNLVQREFATDLMKLNKSFFIKRSEEGAKKMLAAMKQSSSYIHESIRDGQSIWIAQSEGRAKDGMDVTDPVIVKMLALSKRKQDLADSVLSLNIVPVSISYEYDPCDHLKSKELDSIDRYGSYEKPAGEDLLSLVKGLGEFKGKVYLRFGQRVEGEFQSPEEIARAIDRQILDNYQLYHFNYWALRELAQQDSGDQYSETWRALKGSVELTDTEDFVDRYSKCPPEWRHKWLEMYANPVVNKWISQSARMAPC